MEGTKTRIVEVLKGRVALWRRVVRPSLSPRMWQRLDNRHRIHRGWFIAVVPQIRSTNNGQYIYEPCYGRLLDWVQHCERMRPRGVVTEERLGHCNDMLDH